MTKRPIMIAILGLAIPFGASAQLGGNALSADVREKVATAIVEALAAGQSQRVIVELAADDVENEAAAERRRRNRRFDDGTILELRRERYQALKDELRSQLESSRADVFRQYPHLPMLALRLDTFAALERLASHARVRGVYRDETLEPHLLQSNPLIRQPQAATLAQRGASTTVVVLDTGVNYTRADFGSCTAPGAPTTCRVVAAMDTAPDDGALDANGHGTNVAAIVAGVASEAKLAVLDVFDGNSAYSSDVIEGINWAIANQALYDIVAINLSLGSGLYSSACNSGNPFRTPINNARTAGILTTASAGNDASSNSISMPACTPAAVSVGAVYDANIGGISYASCTDSTTSADKIACFSNSASILTMLAPGALITAGGYTYAGTSQAAPQVSGAIAVLRAAYPADTLDATVSRLTAKGAPITDPRNGISKPRIDLLASLGAVNDAFANAVMLSGNFGVVNGANADASKETGEPNHAGNSGGRSLWWQWQAPLTGPVVLNTHGSSFNTLLAVYTGSAVNALSAIAVNDDGSANNTSGVSFPAAGTIYRIAVDGFNGASGTITLGYDYLDSDTDGIIDPLDNCPGIANADQADFDDDSTGDACDSDDDNDGMPDIWENTYGLNPLDPSDAGTDPDGDGVTNLQEYQAGTDPRTDESSGEVPFLPPWAFTLLASLLGVIGMRTRRL